MDVQTRSATANRSRVSIRVTTTFGQVRGVVDHVNIFLTSRLFTVQNLVVVSHAVCLTFGSSPKISGMQETSPLGWGVANPGQRRPSPHYYLAKCARSGSNGNVITDIRWKNLTPNLPHFKVTQGHRSRHGSIGYLWLLPTNSSR